MTSAKKKRIQISLTPEQHRLATALARGKGTTLSGIVRKALDLYLSREGSPARDCWEDDPVLALLGGLELPGGGEEDLNDRIDRSLYGRP